MGIVGEPIENGVGQSCVADGLVPMIGGGIDGQMQRANALSARNLRHVKTGGAPREGRIMRDRDREPEQFHEAGKETLGLAQWHPEHCAKA